MGSAGRVYKVLIAEDQAIIAFCIEETIQGLGPYATACAASISDALKLIETTRFDAALLDIRLRGETSTWRTVSSSWCSRHRCCVQRKRPFSSIGQLESPALAPATAAFPRRALGRPLH
jgi:DNA-binding NarL/FixJ family response regulator